MYITIIIGTFLIVLSVVTIKQSLTEYRNKHLNNMENVYLGKLDNEDCDMEEAMKYLKLTNGLEMKNR